MLRKGATTLLMTIAVAGCAPAGNPAGGAFALQALAGRGMLDAGGPGAPEPAEPAYADALGDYVGSVGAIAPLAAFDGPQALAFRRDGALYVADGPTIRLVAPDAGGRQVVTTVAGDAAAAGHADGPVFQARFTQISALLALPDGDLLVADANRLRRVRFDGHGGGTVTTLTPADPLEAPIDQPPPVVDGPGAIATFSALQGLARTPDGRIWATDAHRLRAIAYDPAAGVLAVATAYEDPDAYDLPDEAWGFGQVAVDVDERLWITAKDQVRRLAEGPAGAFTPDLVVRGDEPSARAGDAAQGRFSWLGGLAALPGGGLALVGTRSEGAVLRVSLAPDGSPRVTVVARSIPFEAGVSRAGGWLDQGLSSPHAIAVGPAGEIRVADQTAIRDVAPDAAWQAVPTTWAGFAYNAPRRDGPAQALPGAMHPRSLTPDGAGGYFAVGLNSIYRITLGPLGTMTTAFVAGRRLRGLVDGPAADAAFDWPTGLLRLHDGSLLVGDSNHRFRRVAFDAGGAATVETLAGGGPNNLPWNQFGAGDGPALAASVAPERAMVEGPDGTIYFADHNRVRKLHRDAGGAWQVTTLAGAFNGVRHVEGPGAIARFGNIGGLDLAPDGTLYVTDAENHLVCQLTFDAAGAATMARVAGEFDGPISNRASGFRDGPAAQARFFFPQDVDVEADGALLVTDHHNSALRRVKRDGSGAWQVTTVVGAGRGKQDGAAGVARLSYPYELVPAGAGKWLCLDGEWPAQQIRTIQLGNAP